MAQRDELAQKRLEIEDQIIVCMAKQGFDYSSQADIYDDWGKETFLTSEIPLFLDHSEWAVEGYGLISAALDTHRTFARVDEEVDDTSVEYNEALYGSQEARDGCASQARDAASTASSQLLELSEIGQEIEERAVERVSASPLVDEWSQCLEVEGYSINGIAGISSYIVDDILQSESEDSVLRDPLIASISYDTELHRFVSSDSDLDANIAELYAAELALARSDLTCSKELYPYAQEIFQEESSAALQEFSLD